MNRNHFIDALVPQQISSNADGPILLEPGVVVIVACDFYRAYYAQCEVTICIKVPYLTQKLIYISYIVCSIYCGVLKHMHRQMYIDRM